MLEINIRVQKPFKILTIITGVIGFFAFVQYVAGSADMPVGGSLGASVIDAEEVIRRERRELAVIERREEILRYQLEALEEERSLRGKSWDSAEEQEWFRARANLLELLDDRRIAEEYIRTALRELREARIRSLAVSGDQSIPLRIVWPVEPAEGISAGFHDPEYEERFGLAHEAIDIPVPQGSEIRAVADGVVELLYEGESGYNYLILSHPGGATLYGHVSAFFVQKGQYVHKGDAIALSGGRPGSAGAGPISTGPHLHFEVIRGGRQVDPMEYLPD